MDAERNGLAQYDDDYFRGLVELATGDAEHARREFGKRWIARQSAEAKSGNG